jgi:putative molybdopterin biosynthesis protein
MVESWVNITSISAIWSEAMSDQDQFLNVIDRDEAERRFHAAISLNPLGTERISLREALGRVLATDVIAKVDVPAFDRSNFDGYAIRAEDSIGATENSPCNLQLLSESIDAGSVPQATVQPHQALSISTGGMLPRGADAILMVEYAEESKDRLIARRAVTPGFGISYAGTDIALGETVLRAGIKLTSRETGVLSAIGEATVEVFRQPIVSIISTGNEVIAPGEPSRPASVYDSNSHVLADAVRELGGIAIFGGIIRDDVDQLRLALQTALQSSDLVLLSGGTSKGRGDLCYRVVAELTDPGIVVHGVGLKPGKPICLAVDAGKPIAILPGFPTSAIFTFHEFIAPVVRALGGQRLFQRTTAANSLRELNSNESVLEPNSSEQTETATLAMRVNSEIGRTEYLLVGLVKNETGLTAFPMGKGSGSVTTFSRADGFITIPRHTEIIESGSTVQVRLLARDLQPADLIVIGSHCIGLDYLLTQLHQRGLQTKLLTVGSSAGLLAAKRGECDLAGIHLLDTQSGQYNRHCVDASVTLVEGYRRTQGIVFRPGDKRFVGKDAKQIVELTEGDSTILMVSRNQGSGTRVLIDRLLQGFKRINGPMQPSNHSAVAAAIKQHRADWGVAIEATAQAANLAFVPLQDELFDFVIPKNRLKRPAVQAFLDLLGNNEVRSELSRLGCKSHSPT